MKKKLLSLFLVLLMVLSFNFTYSQELVSSFPDVSTDSMNLKAIENLKEKGYMIGYEDGTFKPEKIVTRAEFIKILIEKDGGIASVPDGITTGFSDVDTPVPHWAQKYIYLGVKKGYLLGMGDGTFAPDATITYEQAIKILVCHLGKEDAAKAKVSGYLPLWPNAYVVTGEQLELNKDTGLKIGDSVKRAFVAQMVFNSIDVVRPGNNMILPSNDGGTSGNGPTEEISYSKITGIIVSTPGVCIDVNTTSIKKDEPYIKIKYTNSSGEAVYSILREPIPSSGDKSAKNPYKEYIGCEVNIKYYKSDYKDSSGNKINVVSSLSLNSSTKTLKLSAEDIIVDESNATDGIYYYKNGKKQNNPIVLPANLDDMAVVYNGAPINALHPSYDHDWANDETYIKFSDLIPKRGTVTFINRGSGPVEVAVVTDYETIIAKTAQISGLVVDKYDAAKSYTLDETRLLEKLRRYYGSHRTLTADDIEVTMSKSTLGTVTKYEETRLSEITKESVLTIYASKDLTKIDFVLCKDKLGSTSGLKVTTGYDGSSKEVGLDNKTYVVSDYMIKHITENPEIESISEVFPLRQFVVSYVDSFGEIVDVVIKDPDYAYGYLVDVDYKKGSTLAGSYMNFILITESNLKEYNNKNKDETVFSYKVPASGEIIVNNVKYNYSGYDDMALILRDNAYYINYGDSTESPYPKDNEIITNADYAQPIRFIVSDSDQKAIKTIVTIKPIERFTRESTSYFCTTAGNLGSGYKLASKVSVFSVPNDRFEYDKYKIGGKTTITSNTAHNPEVYQETKDGTTVNNCVVLYNESITARPSIKSKFAIVKSKEFVDTVDGDDYYQVELFEPTSQTSGASAKYYIKDTELMAKNITVTPNTNTMIDIGDVIIYGTDKQISIGSYGTKTVIRNLSMVIDISNRDKEGFSKKYKQNGEPTTSDTPYYWFRYGTVLSYNYNSGEDTLEIDVGEEETVEISGTGLFNEDSKKSAKPVFFYKDEQGKPAVAQGGGTRFVDIDGDATVTLNDMIQEGDKILVCCTMTSTTTTIKTVYFIPGYDLEELYPDTVTYTDVTFKVANEGAVVSVAGRTATVIGGEAVITDVPNGHYEYEITLDGYRKKTGNMVVRKGVPTLEVKNEEGSPIRLEAYTTNIRFIVSPGNAQVTFGDETNTGNSAEDQTSYVVFMGVAIGTYDYTVSADGYETVTGTFTVEQGGTTDIRVNLTKIYTVNININAFSGELPEGINFEFGGNPVDIEDGVGEVSGIREGTYLYTISATGYSDVSGEITVGNEQTNMIEETLYKILERVTFEILTEDAQLTVGDTVYALDNGMAEITDIPENTPYFVSKEGFETISGVVEAADENGTIQIELV